MGMSIPVKFQVNLGMESEGRNWETLIMLCDGSLYGIDKSKQYYTNDRGYGQSEEFLRLNPVNRTFAGQMLKEKKKKQIARLNDAEAGVNKLVKELRVYQQRVGELVGQKTKSAFNERLERRVTINQLKEKIEQRKPSIQRYRDEVAHTERCIQKFKGISKPVKERTKPSRTQRAKQRTARSKTDKAEPTA